MALQLLHELVPKAEIPVRFGKEFSIARFVCCIRSTAYDRQQQKACKARATYVLHGRMCSVRRSAMRCRISSGIGIFSPLA